MTRHTVRHGMLSAALAVLALGLAGCATLQVHSFVERGASLTQYHSYAWGPEGVRSTGDPRLDDNEFFEQHVRTAIDKQLAGRGFRSNGHDRLVGRTTLYEQARTLQPMRRTASGGREGSHLPTLRTPWRTQR